MNSINVQEVFFSLDTEIYYRNKTDLELVAAGLQIRIKCEYMCSYFSKYLLSQLSFLRKIRKNENMAEKKTTY